MKETDWQILSVLYEKKSMTKAAEALYMTQSALTKRIKAMEDEWQIEIVKRSSTGVLFTEGGRYLVHKANMILDIYQEIRSHFLENAAAKELLKIGVPNSFARLHMPKLLGSYVNEYDHLHIKTISHSSDVLVQLLTEGTIDIGIVCGDYPYIGEKICLFEEQLFVVAPKGKKLDDIEHMPLISSFLNPIVKSMIDQWWKNEFGTMPHEAHSVPYSDIAIEMVENNLGISFLFGADWRVDNEKVQLIPVYDGRGDNVTRKVWMMISDRCFQSQNIMDFVSFVEKYYQVN